MKNIIEIILNWWVNRPINLISDRGSVSMPVAQWIELSWILVLLYTLLPICLSIIICYVATSKIGNSFRNRWWVFMLCTSFFVAIVIYIKLSSINIVNDNIILPYPTITSLSRALVGFCQSIVYYYLFSGLLSNLLGRIFKINKFKYNLLIPIPKLF